MDTETTSINATITHWPVAVIVLVSILNAILTLVVVRKICSRLLLRRRSFVWLEITPPSRINKTPEATEQLFAVIHGTRATRSFKEILIGYVPAYSFEITSTRKDGIRYFVRLEERRSKSLQQAITSYIPDAKVKEIKYSGTHPDKVIEFKLQGHYILPLTLTAATEQHDPLGYVTGAVSKLSDGEQITLQIVATPIRIRQAEILSHRILRNENILQQVGSGRIFGLGRLANGLGKISSGMTDLASEVFIGTTSSYSDYSRSQSRTTRQLAEVKRTDRPARSLSAFEQELMESMHRKVTQSLFEVSLRILVKSPESARHIAALKSALDSFSVPPYQSLKSKPFLPLVATYRHRLAIGRLPSLMRRSSMILASSELASLYHFPASHVSKTDNLITSLSRTLPAPVSLKSGRKLAVLIGENHHHETITPIGLTEEERERHMYIIGGTGNGKTTMLFYQILQDIRVGNGVAVLDPHGDLAERILRYIPEERVEDVIYINPDDLAHPIGINLLELSPDLKGDDLLREKDLITEAAISVLRKIFSDDDSGGHRIEYVLRNTIQTALTIENPTLFTIFELLNDAKYRRKIVKGLEDKNLKDFWNNEIGKAGDMQKVKMVAGITAKIGRFLFSASARRMLEQPKSTINFETVLADRKILICNFSKGLLGEDTSALFGTTVLAKLQTASLRRARIGQDNRTPYYLYVDEFQNFATTSFVQMLSEARKYKLFLTMAEQSTAQQDEQRLVDIILANVGTVVCFRSGSPTDERLTLPLFMPFIQPGEIANLPSYSYYVRISAVTAQEPMSGMTVVVSEEGSESVAKNVITSSRHLYTKRLEVDTPENRATLKVPGAPSKAKKSKEKRTKNKQASEDLSLMKSVR